MSYDCILASQNQACSGICYPRQTDLTRIDPPIRLSHGSAKAFQHSGWRDFSSVDVGPVQRLASRSVAPWDIDRTEVCVCVYIYVSSFLNLIYTINVPTCFSNLIYLLNVTSKKKKKNLYSKQTEPSSSSPSSSFYYYYYYYYFRISFRLLVQLNDTTFLNFNAEDIFSSFTLSHTRCSLSSTIFSTACPSPNPTEETLMSCLEV